MPFLPKCIYWNRDIVICFKEILKDPNVNLIMEQFKLQYLCSAEANDASGTSWSDQLISMWIRIIPLMQI